MSGGPVLSFDNVTKRFPVGDHRWGSAARSVEAVKDLTLSIEAGQIVGLVGQSGAGKTTVGRLALGLERPDEGLVRVDGVNLGSISARRLRGIRRDLHMIFQDPYQSLHPGMTIGRVVTEPLEIAHVGRRERRVAAVAALEEVHLTPATDFLDRFPHELSGGQRQRVAFARALASTPRCVIADEPTSMLDVSLRASILELVEHLRQTLNCAVLYITHDLAVARHVCDQIGVLYQGRMVEIGAAQQIVDAPTHAYTKRLLDAAGSLGR